MKTGLSMEIHNVVQRRLSPTPNAVSNSPKVCKTSEPLRRRVELTQSTRWRNLTFLLLTLMMLGALTACKAEKPSRMVSIDGSSTVYPLSKALAEAFGKLNPAVQFKIEFS
ncbi:MAG TPA: hypothetical protein VKB81_02720, partial [Nitrospira sp.]|nr:hypothetical protein [Nitrospira sp.]